MSKMTLERKNDGLWLHVTNGEQQCSFHLGYGLREDGKELLAVQLLRAHLAALTAVWHNRPAQEACPFCGKVGMHPLGETCLNNTPSFDLADAAQEKATNYVSGHVDSVGKFHAAAQNKAEPVAWQRRIKADQGNWLRWEYFSGADEYGNDRSKFPDQVGRWRCEYRALHTDPPAERVRVPGMPTREMYEATFEIKQYVAFDRFCRDWQQMLSAAPEAGSHG